MKVNGLVKISLNDMQQNLPPSESTMLICATYENIKCLIIVEVDFELCSCFRELLHLSGKLQALCFFVFLLA